jgi:anti-sigma factor RsiW
VILAGTGGWYRRAIAAIAAGLGLAIIGGACGWAVRDDLVKREREGLRETRYLRTLLSAHRIFARDPPAGVTLPASEFARLSAQIDRGLGATVRLPAAGDWPLVFRGGRLLPLGRKPAALLVFARGQDHVSLIARRGGHAPSAFDRPLDGTSVRLAMAGQFQIGVVGEVSPDEFAVLKQIVGIEAQN